MPEKPQVTIGQVWREKDKRFVRYVKVDSYAVKNEKPAAWCLACDVNGRIYKRGTRIKVVTLQTRFELVQS